MVKRVPARVKPPIEGQQEEFEPVCRYNHAVSRSSASISRPPGARSAGRVCRVWASVLVLLTAAACSAPREEGASEAPKFADIAHPSPEVLEPALAAEVKTQRSNLEALQNGDHLPPAELARAYGELGRLYQAHRLLEAALDCYREAHRLDPQAFNWAYYLGVLSASDGNVDDAAGAFARALELRPGDLPSLIRLADLELDRGEIETARGLYQEAVSLDGSLAAAANGLGRAEVAGKRYAEAIEHFNRAVAIQPDASVIHYHLGQAYRQLGQLETAESHLARSGKVRVAMPDPLIHDLLALALGAGPHLSRGNGAMREGRLGEAAAEYRLAVAADPENSMARQSLGSALARLGDLEGAAAEFNAAVRLEPSARAHSDLGIMLAELGDDGGSLRHLRRAAELEPELEKVQLNLANALGRLGHYGEAAEAYRRLLEADPSNPQAHLTLADLLVRQEELQEALVHYHRARELLPTLGAAWVREATIL